MTWSSTATRGVTGPRRPFGGLGGFGSLAFSIPLGLSAGRPFSPLSRAISARWAVTVCSRDATLPSNSMTSAFSSVGESASRSPGEAILPGNQRQAPRESENRAAPIGFAAIIPPRFCTDTFCCPLRLGSSVFPAVCHGKGALVLLINGLPAAERLRVRQEQSAPLVAALETWLRDQRSRLSRSAAVAEPIDYMLRRWPSFVHFLDDGRICLSNNAAERALRGFALGRKSWLFAGSERGADRAAAIATLIMTAKLNEVDPQAWLADVLARIAEHPTQRLEELLPWRWAVLARVDQAA